MNAEEIIRHPEINGGKTKTCMETTHTEIVDGKLKRVVSEQTSYAGREPDYIKVYTDCFLSFNHINMALSPYIVAFGKWMTFANFDNPDFRCTVRTGEVERKDVARCVGVSESMVKKMIAALVENEIFIPIYIKGKQKRGIYFVNPWVIAKGEWKDIKELRAQFEFVAGASSVLSIGEDGERKVICPITQRETPVIPDYYSEENVS